VKRSVLVVGAGLVLAAIPALRLLAQPTATPWVHIRVEEPGKPSKVSVNLPLTVVQAALRSAPETVGAHGHIQLGRHHHLSVAELRRLWAELKSAGEADFVTLEEEGHSVRVGRKGDTLEVRVERPEGDRETHVQVPVALVDALLSSEGEELNLEAAMAELQKRRGEIVQVDDEDSKVRIWIDEANR
jgi:hypothetical protein